MPADWLFYWLTRPGGLILIGIAVGIPFLIWRTTLGPKCAAIGSKPLAFAYLYAGIGLVAMVFAGSYGQFSGSVAAGMLPEAQRWSIVPGWTIYMTVLSLVPVLPLLGLIAVPVAASLLKRACLTLRNIGLCALVAWLALVILLWSLPGNEWERTHRLESFLTSLESLLPGILFVALPFMLGIYNGTRSYRLGSHDRQEQ